MPGSQHARPISTRATSRGEKVLTVPFHFRASKAGNEENSRHSRASALRWRRLDRAESFFCGAGRASDSACATRAAKGGELRLQVCESSSQRARRTYVHSSPIRQLEAPLQCSCARARTFFVGGAASRTRSPLCAFFLHPHSHARYRPTSPPVSASVSATTCDEQAVYLRYQPSNRQPPKPPPPPPLLTPP